LQQQRGFFDFKLLQDGELVRPETWKVESNDKEVGVDLATSTELKVYLSALFLCQKQKINRLFELVLS
jgi:hypothetical protein